jgi:hypothetical protein
MMPLNFNPVNKIAIENSVYADKYHNLENQLKDLTEEKEYNLLIHGSFESKL